MSIVTTIMISHNQLENHHREQNDFILDKFNNFLSITDNRTYGFKELDESNDWGGNRYPQCNILAGGFHYFNHIEVPFLKFLLTIDWKYPTAVQIFIKHEEADRFGLLMFNLDETHNQPIGYKVLCDDEDDVQCIFDPTVFEFEDAEHTVPVTF